MKTTRRVVAIAGMSLLVTCVAGYVLALRPNVLVGQPSRRLDVPSGMTFVALRAKLQQQGYVANVTSFTLLARLLGYDRQLRPGAYRLVANMSNWSALRLLRAGLQQPVKIILPQVRTKAALAAKITQNIALSAAAFEELLADAAFLQQYGFNLHNVLAMFVPNTYEVYWTVSAQGLFARMHREYQRFWTARRRGQAAGLGLTPVQVATLASIVQCETNKAAEAPLIAGVYLNRLRKGMALASCPTLLYILDDPSAKRVLHKHKALASPYNTYKHKGLPPGPIGVPTIAMVEAVLGCGKHGYLYFAAKADFSGYHHFARTLKEHLRYARRYQKALNKAQVYR